MARKNLQKGFKRPKSIHTQLEHSELKPNYGKFTAFPFEPGFGTTIGNTLRRVLLSSIQGYAVTSVRISSFDEGAGVSRTVSSEFETIPGIVEDTLEVINNLKQVRLRLPDDKEAEILHYEWSGKGEIKSGDFARPGQLEVANPGQHIMTMDNANLEFEIKVELGRGYLPSDANDHLVDVIGTIPMDAIFSPVKKVKYSVVPTRVGQRNDYDKLELEIWTDGTIEPDDALGEAAKIAKDHLSVFINFDENSLGMDDDFNEDDDRIRQILNTPVDELELSVRSSNCLKNANIKNVGDLTRRTEDDLAKTRNFGKKSLQEIKEKLKEWNLYLGITDMNDLKKAYKVKSQKEADDEA